MTRIDRVSPYQKRPTRRPRLGLGRRPERRDDLTPAQSSLARRLVVVAVPTPEAGEHKLEGVVVHAPPHLERFEKATLENPKILDPKVLEGGTTEGWDVRLYDPKAYREEGKTTQHVKSFSVDEKAQLKQFLKPRISGDVSSQVESSHKRRWLLSRRVRARTRKLHRPSIDSSEIV